MTSVDYSSQPVHHQTRLEHSMTTSPPKHLLSSTWRVLIQPPSPTLRELLSTYDIHGETNKEMLMTVLNAKSAEDSRMSSIAALHHCLIEIYHVAPISQPGRISNSTPNSAPVSSVYQSHNAGHPANFYSYPNTQPQLHSYVPQPDPPHPYAPQPDPAHGPQPDPAYPYAPQPDPTHPYALQPNQSHLYVQQSDPPHPNPPHAVLPHPNAPHLYPQYFHPPHSNAPQPYPPYSYYPPPPSAPFISHTMQGDAPDTSTSTTHPSELSLTTSNSPSSDPEPASGYLSPMTSPRLTHSYSYARIENACQPPSSQNPMAIGSLLSL